MYAKLTETQLSRTNFVTKQKEWLGKYCPDFIDKDFLMSNSSDLHPLNYHVWGAMLQKFKELKTKPQNAMTWNSAGGCRLSGMICLMKQFANLFWAFVNRLWHASTLKADIRTFNWLIYLLPSSLDSWAHATFQHLCLSIANLCEVRYLIVTLWTCYGAL